MSFICNLCGKAYVRLSKLFEHLRHVHDIDILDRNVKDYIDTRKLTPDEVQRMWDEYWTGKD